MFTARGPAGSLLNRAGLRDQRGFTLVECLVAMLIFAIVATGLAGLLASGVTAHQLGREKTLAKQNALAQIEYLRSWTYDNLGFVGGNPSGTVPTSEASKQVSLNTGASGNNTGTMTTQIAYVNDPTPTSYATAANYKRVTVTVTRNRDSKQILRSVTYVAPATRAPLGGINNAIVNVTVTDAYLATPIENATVDLGAGPSAPRSDVTDATGKVSFPALTPTTGGQPNYTVSVPDANGYETMPEDKPPASGAQFALSPTQTIDTAVRLYKPVTINLTVTNPLQGIPPGTTCVAYWLYIKSSRRAQKVNLGCGFSGTTTIDKITTSNDEDLIPGLTYTLSVQKDVNPGPSRYYAPAVTQTVPSANYPTNLAQTYTMTLGSALASRSLTVQVRKSGVAVPGARVDVIGGPSPGYYFTDKADASGNVTFNVPQTASTCPGTCYTVQAWNAAGTGSTTSTNVSVNSNKTITVSVP